MNDASGPLLVLTVAVVGVLHPVVPDHWVPITLLARQRGWSKGVTARTALLAGTGHVATTLIIGLVVWAAGVAFATRFSQWVDTIASVALIVFGACVDGPSDAREKMRILTGGSIAIMCPASHEGVPRQVISSSASPSCLRAVARFNCLPRRSSRHSRALPCKPHIRRDDVPTTVPHSGRESSRRTAPLY
jgi:hypothetical protein